MRIFAIKSPDIGVGFAAALDGLPNRNLELSRIATRGVSSVTVSHVEGGILPGRSSRWILVLGRLWVERVAESVAQEIKGEEGQ